MILDGLSLGFFSLLSCLIPLCHFTTCPQPAFLNDMKPGKKAENVFFFLFCKRQEITHQLRSPQQRTESCSWVSAGGRIARRPQDPSTHPCLPKPGQSSSPSASTAPTLGSLPLSGELNCISVFFRLSWGHSSASGLLLGCNPISASSSPAWPWSHTASCEGKAFKVFFLRFLLSKDVLVQLKWNRALFSLPARLCVCVGVCIYSSGTDEMVAATLPFKPVLHL